MEPSIKLTRRGEQFNIKNIPGKFEEESLYKLTFSYVLAKDTDKSIVSTSFIGNSNEPFVQEYLSLTCPSGTCKTYISTREFEGPMHLMLWNGFPEANSEIEVTNIKLELMPDLQEKEQVGQTIKINNIDNKVSIIILTRNQLNIIKQCYESIIANTTFSDYEIIVLDNSDNEETTKWAKDKNIKYYKKTINSFSKGNNWLAEKATGSFLCFLNDDTIPQSGWLQRLVEAYTDNVGITGSALYFPDKSIQSCGISFNYKTGYVNLIQRNGKRIRKKHPHSVWAVAANAMLIKKQLFSELNNFDEEYCWNFEDIDLCMKVRHLAKRDIVVVPESSVIHLENTSMNKMDKIRYYSLWQHNRNYFLEKWFYGL